MQKSAKVVLIVSIILIVIVSAVFIVANLLIMGQQVQPFSLDNAPEHIIAIKTDLKAKLEDESFSWDDMEDFVTLSQYIADNSPEVREMTKGWEQTVLFDIDDSDHYMWFLLGNNSLKIVIGDIPPENPGILINLGFETVIDILKGDETPLSAFQKGTLTYEGPFNEVLTVAQITGIASATIMDTYSPPIARSDFKIMVDQSNLYIDGGLTLFPSVEIFIKPDHLGEHHMSSLGMGAVIITDHAGTIIKQLDNSAHSVHKFINSTTVMMGGQEGFMELWNYQTDVVETLNIPGGHHEIDYNPETDTFMILEYVYSSETWNGTNVIYDVISEYDRTGNLVWQWDPRVYFPFNSTRFTSLGLNETFRGGADWMHSNSFVWDKSEDVIYLHPRTLDTILKIDYNTKNVIWDAGRMGDFTLFNKAGEEVDSLFYHAHSLERTAANRFIIYDNDLYNLSNPNTMTLENSSGHSRLLEFEIDVNTHIMKEIWSYVPTNESYYFPESGGDADRLPNGNTLGIFGNKGLVLNLRDPTIITEVTQEGQVAWELQIPGINDTYYWVHRVERFFEKPLISVHNISINANEGLFNFSTWNCFKQDILSPGTVKILANGQEIHQESFNFQPYWQPTDLEIIIDNLPSSVREIRIIVENEDGILNTMIVDLGVSVTSIGDIPQIIETFMVALPVMIFLKKKKHQKGVK